MIDGLQADSTAVDKYLRGITNLKSSSFTEKTFTSATHKISIEGDNMSPVNVDAVLTEDKSLLVSNQNSAVFEESMNNNFNKLFTSKTALY